MRGHATVWKAAGHRLLCIGLHAHTTHKRQGGAPRAILADAAGECNGHHVEADERHDGLSAVGEDAVAQRVNDRLVANLEHLVHEEAAWHADGLAAVGADLLRHDLLEGLLLRIVEGWLQGLWPAYVAHSEEARAYV